MTLNTEHCARSKHYNKSKLFLFNYEIIVGSNIAVIKKTVKNSGFVDGFKSVLSRKKKRDDTLKDDIKTKKVSAKVLGNRFWGSEADNTTESDSVNIEKKYLIKKTSFDYGSKAIFNGKNTDQTSKNSCVKTKKVLGESLSNKFSE
ncbi:hypothetical protein G9A89_006369 [Geosiphon pyriformis]|nr:hypothetical protein G9A89_006369 [Geosiphon pyriformis]